MVEGGLIMYSVMGHVVTLLTEVMDGDIPSERLARISCLAYERFGNQL